MRDNRRLMAAPPLSPPRRQVPPPRPHYLITADGWSLHLASYPPPCPPPAPGAVEAGPASGARAAILLAPGMMLDGRAMDRPPGRGLASFFRRRGYLVYSLDLRGHGESRPRAARCVDWSFDDLVTVDIPLAISAVKARHPDLPLVWLGHSLSAHAGAVAVGQRPELPADLLVLLCPGAWIRELEPSWLLWQGKRATLWLWNGVTAVCGRFPAARLGIGTNDESRGYVRQHREWAAAGRWQSRDGSADYLAGLARIRQPALVVAAAGDWLCRPASVRLLAAAIAPAPSGMVELWEVTGRDLSRRRHPGHMDVLTAPPAERLWERIDDWISRHLAGPVDEDAG
jgi:predicted alpha/beta hydrolase